MLYEARLKAWRDEQSRLQGALREGRTEGWREGRQEGVIEIAAKMKKGEVPVNQIAEYTGLSPDEIAAL
jgi:predicted transposase/invertase (TIGR01784 family)